MVSSENWTRRDEAARPWSTSSQERGTIVIRTTAVVAVLLAAAFVTATALADPWSFVGTNAVASSPVQGGGYPVATGRTKPDPGTCRLGGYNSNRSESWLAVKPGTEDLVGTSKFFFETFSTFYMFHLGSYRILDGTPVEQQPGAGLRLHLDRDAGHAAELDGQHRSERRFRHARPRLPDDAALQRVLGRRPASEPTSFLNARSARSLASAKPICGEPESSTLKLKQRCVQNRRAPSSIQPVPRLCCSSCRSLRGRNANASPPTRAWLGKRQRRPIARDV